MQQDRKERKKQAKREDILNAAKALYAHKGSAFTMQELADLSDVAKGSVYLHFADKEALTGALVVEALQVVQALIKIKMEGLPTGMDRLMAMGKAYVQFYRQYPFEFSLVGALDFLSPGIGWAESPQTEVGQMVQHFKDFIMGQIKAGIQDGSIRKDIDPALSSFLVSQTVKMFVQKMAQVEKEGNLVKTSGYDAETLIEGLFDILKRAFVPGGQK